MKKNMKKNMLWMLLSLMAAAIMMPLSATAQETPTETRIAVVSDIHVMARSLLPEEKGEGTPWDTYYKGQRKMLEQSAGLFDQFIDAMKSEAPDVLLITGDLTKDGELVSHQYVRGLRGENGENEDSGLKKLEAAGIQVYVIPGNHDFGGETDPLDPTKDADKLSTAGFASFYTGYGYGIDNDNKDPNSLSYVADIADGLYLLAIDSHNSSVSESTLNWIKEKALIARAAGKRVIAMMHHPLFPHITGANMFIDTYTVANYVDVRNALINAGVNVILTGHFHTSDIAYDWYDDATVINKGIYDINTGSLISYPCDYRMLTLSADKKTLSVKTKSLTETPALIPSGYESWKDWMNKRVKSVVSAKIIREHPDISNNFLATIAINQVAQFAAKLFILHAEGNEPNSPENNTYETLYSEASLYAYGAETYNITIDLLGPTHSILEDKSYYNETHENQTNDRTLTINLDSPSSLLLELDNNDDNSSVINYYNGKEATVTLTGRTFIKDGFWNTICLPFDIADINAKDANDKPIWPLYGATIRQLDTESEGGEKTGIYTYDNYSKLYLNFSDPTTSIVAGVPYIVKWGSGSGEDITNPSFSGVTIDKTIRDASFTGGKFCGNYNYLQFDSDDTGKLLIGINTGMSTLFYPKANASLGACRAYFQLADDYTAGEPDTPGSGPSEIRNFVLNFGDDDSATGIIAIGDSQLSTLNAQRSEWFTLDGRRLAAKPTAKGLYIHAGKKVVIK